MTANIIVVTLNLYKILNYPLRNQRKIKLYSVELFMLYVFYYIEIFFKGVQVYVHYDFPE